MGNLVTYFGDCKSPGSAPADGISAGTGKFGNLARRKDNLRNLEETFLYDKMNRLTDIYLGNTHSQIVYDPLSRMTSKQADGQTVFSSAQYDFTGLDGQLRPHALSSAQVGSNPFPTQGLGLGYTMFDKVLQITWPSNNSMQFDYGYDHQRIRSVKSMGLNPAEKTYIGNCEKIHALPISDVYRTYLSGPMGVFAVVEQVSNTENITYILKDHLGSWTVFTDEDGDLIREESFDAWGNRRNAATWTGAAIGDLLFDRGFTGHEHIENIGLINMNGRLYDPVMSTFLSVDNYVQEPDFSQNFNRYAYCLNNPLKYVDPDGESITLLTAIAISAAVSMVSTVATNIVYDRPLYEGLGKAAVVGALQGVFSFGIGTAAGIIGEAVKGVSNATWGMVAQAGFQVLAHGTLGGISTEARGGKFWNGFASGAAASFVASTTGIMTDKLPKAWQVTCMVAAGGLSGGVTATMAGGYFWDGVCNGLICSGLNHAMHLAVGPDDPPSPDEMKERIRELVKAKLSLNIVFSSNILFDKKSGQWMGKNFKFNSMQWGGNRYTGGKYKFAQKTSNILKSTGYAISLYQGGKTLYDYAQGNISTSEMVGELGFNAFTTLTGEIGAAIGVGRALSGVVINTEWYQDFKFNMYYWKMESQIGAPNENNQQLWIDFINKY